MRQERTPPPPGKGRGVGERTGSDNSTGGEPELAAAHLDELRASALSDAAIARLRWFTNHHGALVLPYLRPDGSPETCHDGKPFRRTKPAWTAEQLAQDPPPPKYLSPKGQGCRLYHSHQAIAAGGYPERLAAIHVPLRITEGEKKTEAATLHDPASVTIGLGGVSSWRDRYDGGDSETLVDFEEIPVESRTVRLCFDSDTDKPQVAAALRGLAEMLKGRGAYVLIERLPNDLSGERLGLDDLIHRYGAAYFLRIAHLAQPAFITKGKGENATQVFNLPEEPDSAHDRAVYLAGMVGSHWRQSPNGERFWHQWTGTHWVERNGNDPVNSLIERFMDAQGWKRREGPVIRDLRDSLRRVVGPMPPAPVHGLVPFRNGCLRLSDRVLIDHRPEHGNRWCLPFPWQPEATAPRTEAFLLDRLGDPASVAVWRAFANCILTGTRPKAFLEISGVSDSGKSVVARLLEALVGSVNTVAGKLARLEDDGNRFETYRFRDARLAVFPESGRYSGSLETVKAMTGGDPITAEAKGSNAACSFVFQGGVLIVGNAPVQPSDNSGAVINRRRSLPVPNAIPAAQQRVMLDHDGNGGWRGALAGELPGLAAWVLAMDPADVRAALASSSDSLARRLAELQVLLETDGLARWAEEHLVWDEGAVANVGTLEQSPHTHLLPSYSQAITREGGYPLSMQKFKQRLVEMLRDTLRLPMPPGPINTGRYRGRCVGSLVPCVRFRKETDDDAPGVIRYAYQRNGSDKTGMDQEWKEPRRGTDGTDGMDTSNPPIGNKEEGGKSHIGESAPESVPSIPSVSDQGFCHSETVPDPCRSVPDGAARTIPAQVDEEEGWTLRHWPSPQVGPNDKVPCTAPDGSFQLIERHRITEAAA